MNTDSRKGHSPAYLNALEMTMNATQKRGRLLTGVVCGMLLAPWLVLNGVHAVWLQPHPAALGGLALATWLLVRLWRARPYARQITALLAAVAGAAGLLLCTTGQRRLGPALFLLFLVFGLVYLWCAWILQRSRDIPEFLKLQARQSAEP